MRRFNYRKLRELLPALAQSPRSRRAERYLRERFPEAATEAKSKERPRRRSDGVREYSLTALTRRACGAARNEAAVPYLRMSGRWLDKCGFPVHARVFVKVEPGRLVLTTEDPA